MLNYNDLRLFNKGGKKTPEGIVSWLIKTNAFHEF